MPKINDSEIQSLNKEVRRKKKTKKNETADFAD
jgi:hypothetical protein